VSGTLEEWHGGGGFEWQVDGVIFFTFDTTDQERVCFCGFVQENDCPYDPLYDN